VIFADTTANIYSWSGEIIKRDERQRGELAENSLTDRDFNNFVNRINLTWKISPNDELLLSNLVAQQSTIGRDETETVEEDFLTRRQFLQKDILGLQYQRKWLNQRLITAVAGKWYFYKLEGVEPFSFTDVLTNEDQLGYYASAKYNFTDNFFIRASYESALRIPTFDQFFGNGASVLSNPELKPESSDNANLGFSFRSKKRGSFSYGLTANGFLRGQNELIFLNNEIFQQFRNAEDVRTIGVEGEVLFEFWEKLRLQYNVTRLSQTYESINESNVSSQFLVGTPFPNNPNFFMNARLSYDLPQLLSEKDGLRIYTQYKYVDEFNFINVGQIYDPANFVPVQHRLDAGLVYSLFDNKISLAFNANNILDADIFDIFSIPRPGRNFNFKITYTFQDF
ncbi:MAG: TonB-dependent receptor, partial [Bacteroidota bacterium]